MGLGGAGSAGPIKKSPYPLFGQPCRSPGMGFDPPKHCSAPCRGCADPPAFLSPPLAVAMELLLHSRANGKFPVVFGGNVAGLCRVSCGAGTLGTTGRICTAQQPGRRHWGHSEGTKQSRDNQMDLPRSLHVPGELKASLVKQGHPGLWPGRPWRNPLLWQETGMCFPNPQCWDSCEGVNAGFHFMAKRLWS